MTVESPSAAIEPNVRSFLVTPVRYATIATVNRDGSPHQTVIWFVLRGDRIIV
ncbi:MAG TPA: pyridoxamine 5'-phosphate oxidase family protein, partial [Candidatus Limnocylindria bacterium]|nr:pyridoxamine 5'-phosphate oxidase family protein [Candidatus Limnocylindria bacterium]